MAQKLEKVGAAALDPGGQQSFVARLSTLASQNLFRKYRCALRSATPSARTALLPICFGHIDRSKERPVHEYVKRIGAEKACRRSP
jgi:hypothetical protein